MNQIPLSSFPKTKIHWLDLRGLGISILERLVLEEFLLRHDDHGRSWAIMGTHEPLTHKYLTTTTSSPRKHDPRCIIVMGIGGKPEKLLDIPKVQQDGIMVVKRFSGGGTVVLDHNSIWTTWIGRNQHFPHVEPFPRPIMDWSANFIYKSAFSNLKVQALRKPHKGQKTMVVECKSCGTSDSSGMLFLQPPSTQQPQDIPDFALRENDYILGERKMGGNAQSIVKDSWLHHTSFLWDYHPDNMEYLTLPSKRPNYRGDRPHAEFLTKLKDVYPGLLPSHFFTAIRTVSETVFDDVEVVTLPEVIAMVNDQFGGLQKWYDGKCRTRIVEM